MGVRRGVADLLLTIPAGVYHGLYIEMKCEGGRQNQDQMRFERSVVALGFKYVVVDTLELFIATIQAYLAATQFHKPVWGQTRLSRAE